MSSKPIVGIFDQNRLFTTYRVQASFEQRVMGGIPKDPGLIEAWLRGKLMPAEHNLAFEIRRILEDQNIVLPEDAPDDQIVAIAKELANKQKGNTFRHLDGAPALAAYNVKANLKESASIVYPYYFNDPNEPVELDEKGKAKKKPAWRKNGKAYRSFLAECIFVDPYAIPFMRRDEDGNPTIPVTEPDGVHIQVGHVSGPQGKRSTLTYYDFVEKPVIEFTISSMRDMITMEEWENILVCAQRQGLGAVRSMNYGQFKITAFDKI